MIRPHLIAISLAAGLGLSPAAAFDFGDMTAAQQQAFGESVRAYLLENPEVLLEAMDVYEERRAAAQAAADENLVSANASFIFDDDHSFVTGNLEGDVTVVEFIDYRCSFCRRAHPEVSELVSSDGSIRKIIKEFPILGPESLEASRFAISVLQIAGDEAYAKMNDTLMAYRGAFTRDALARLAADQGLDADPIMAGMDSEAVTNVIAANHALAQALGITGTPTFVVGDQMLRGYVPLDDMRDVVAQVRGE